MSRRFRLQQTSRAALAAVICLVALGGLAAQRVAAAEPLKDSSLKFVPADAAFYSASFRMKQQFDDFLKTNAYARLKSMPFYKMAMFSINTQLQNPMIAGELGKPENKELLKLLGEMFSNEVFIFGDNRFAELGELFALVSNANQLAQFEGLVEGDPTRSSGDPRKMLLMLHKNRAKLKTPNMVIGFKIADARAGANQLARLKTLIDAQLARHPDLKKRFRKRKIAGHDYLTLSLDGSLIPWDEVPFSDYEKEEGEFQELIDHLKNMKLTLTIGLRGKYVLLAVGETADQLKSLDGGKSLYDVAEFAPLRKLADKPITGITYLSRRYAQSFGSNLGQIDQMIAIAQKAFDKAPVDDKVKREFRADARKFRKAVEEQLPEPGAKLSFSFRNSHGYEGYAWDWGKNKTLDDSKKLSLLDHVGGSPIAFFVARTKSDPEGYATLVAALKRMFYYGEKALLGQIPDKERAQYQKVRKIVLPLIARLHKANTDLLIPALKDGQTAFVLDAKIKSRRWFPMMPPTEQPLPMLELGLVFGVSDAEKLKKGCAEYYAVARKLIDAVRKEVPDLPPFKFPSATKTTTAAGTIYHYPQLQQFGIDEQIAPAAGLSKNVAVLSTSRKMAQRVLARNPISLAPGLLSDRNRPLASASYFNWPALVDTASPWIDYGVQQYFQQLAGADAADAQAKAILDQVHSGLEILKCFRGVSTATYREGQATVTHFESVWKDLKK